MYITALDMLAIMIALVVSVTLVVTTAIANARLTTERDYWRKVYHNYKFASDAEAMGKPYSWNSVSSTWEYK
jgi:hypothetical protein